MDKLFQAIIFTVLNFDKRLKKYFGIETPLYRFYWQRYSNYMQQKLNAQHKK